MGGASAGGAASAEPLLIGVDGGSSGVRAVAVRVVEREPGEVGALEQEHYDEPSGPGRYEPRSLTDQRAEQRAPALGALEREVGRLRVAAAARCIARVAAARGARRVRVGMALPGIKTADGRGTCVVKNGPRVPDFSARLEAELVGLGLEPSEGLGPLYSDGTCAGHGEHLAQGGALRGLDCGYYLGGGTGLSEVLLLDGEVVGLDAVADWFPRAVDLDLDCGSNFEQALSPAAFNAGWRARAGRGARELPEEHLDSDVLAVAALTHVGTQLGRLVHLRLTALAARGYRAERVVVGQRLARLLADPRTEFFLRRTAERELARLLCTGGAADLAGAYLTEGGTFGRLRPGLLVASSLRSAPALGAAWCKHVSSGGA